MKKYIKYMFVVAMLTTSINVFSQTTTVTFKPNATIGQDAVIQTKPNTNYANTNYNNLPELIMLSWSDKKTADIHNARTLIKFTQLSSIPTNARILSATLKLYGVSSSINVTQGNSSYPNTIYGSNDLLVQKVNDYWNENIVDWNNQPQTIATNQFTIPASNSQWNWNYFYTSTLTNSPELVNMVQSMVSNNNQGFMIKTAWEVSNPMYYAAFSMLFASSDNSNSALWPELIVTYEIIDCDFTTCVSTTDQNLYTFSAVNTYGNHTWKIYDVNGNQIYSSNLSSFNYTFAAGSYSVEHKVSTDNQLCTSYIGLCVDQSQLLKSKQKENSIINDENTQIDIKATNSIKVYPNPSSDDWNVTLTSENAESVDVIISDCGGKIVSTYKKNLTKGDNSFVLEGSKLPKGIYVLAIKGGTTNFTQKLSKN